MSSVPRPIKLEVAYDDPHAIRALVERSGPYRSIGSYLPPSATQGRHGDTTSAAPLPWFRSNWAVNGRCLVQGADAVLYNERFIEAASQLFDTPRVTPTTVVVNVNAPMAAGAVHVDIPSFRGVSRDRYALRLLQAMGTSGLFEAWRVVEAGAVSWFYSGPGGAYDYWPDGLHGPMRSQRPPFNNLALVADNDRMYHRIGWVGDPAAPALPITTGAEIAHGGDGWTITDDGRVMASYPNDEIRISLLWKARVERSASAEEVGPLTDDQVAGILGADLRRRGLDAPSDSSAVADEAWIDLVHATYYPAISDSSAGSASEAGGMDRI